MEASSGIHAVKSDYLERYVQIGVAGAKVVSVSFPRSPDSEATAEHELIDRLQRYLDGSSESLADIEVGLTVPGDQRRVLEALRTVPHGEQVSVEQLARMVPGLDADDDADRSLVRQALAENPIPIIIPDHRVRDGPSGAQPEVEQRLRSLEGL